VRAFLLGVLATIVVAAVCGYIVLRSGLVPANADAEPGWLEIWAANTSLDATLDREAPKGPNPVTLTDAKLSRLSSRLRHVRIFDAVREAAVGWDGGNPIRRDWPR